ncbi:MAG: hypothetical protein P8X57_09120, partial [Cyclobacteriaceae bacterium]
MKTILTICLTLFAVISIAQDSGELTIPLTNPDQRAKVVVDLRKGSIEVTGTERSDILVRYQATGSSPESESNNSGLKRIGSAALDLEITENNNEVIIESSSWQKGVNVYVEIPRNADLHMESYNQGDLLVRNVNGEITADSYNGRITAENISGSLVADTYNGPITATFTAVTPDTPMAFSTYNGNVDLTFPGNFKGSMKMKTNRGDIFSGFDFA